MKTVKKTINGIDVTFIKTKKFKSICGGLYFKTMATKENITSRSLLRRVMVRSTNKYDTNEKLSLNILENYDPYIEAETFRVGNYLNSAFYFETLEDRYTKKGNLKNVIDTFLEIVFNPNVENGAFSKKDFEFCYNKFMLSLDKVKENQSNYSSKRLLNYLNQNKAYSFKTSKEKLRTITPQTLYLDYKDMINNSEVSLIIVGNVDENDPLFESIANNIKSSTTYEKNLIISNDDEEDNYNNVVEKGNGKESILHMICNLKSISSYERNYVIPIYRFILGGGGISRLFKEVREKKSLAYYCFARYEKDDSLIDIITGIEKENLNEVIDIIKNELKNMNNLTSKELSNAKKDLISSLIESKDYIFNLMTRYKHEEIYGLPDTNEYVKMLKNVTKEEVESISQKVSLNLSYFLEGCDDSEQD